MKNFNPQPLRDVVRQIQRAKDWNQTVTGENIGASQTMVSDMSRADSEWQTHWEVFWRILGLCEELGIDPARDLKASSEEEALQYVERKADQQADRSRDRGKRVSKKVRAGGVSSGRTKGD